MANIFPIDFEEKLTMAQDDYILFSDSEDGNKIKKAQYKNLKGEKGDTGTAATITVGSTTTGTPGSSASVTNSGTSSAAVLDFTIPKGDKGDTGQTGPAIVSAAFNGNDIDFTEEDGNVVTLTDAKIDLKGDKGDAATVSVGSTTTLPAGSSAAVTNSGTSSAAVFNFGIPKGDKGDTGNTGATGNGIASITSSKVGKITTVTITETNSTVDTFQISDGEDGQGSGDVLGPNSSVDGDIVVFDGITGKIIKDSNKTIGALESAISSNTSDISTINSKIPSAATSSNQLADKDYVNDGINSVTAYYITKDAQGDQWATRAELFAATTFYSGGVVRVPTKNDYTIVLADEQHDNATTRYIYNSGWEYQYTVNETALTQAQLNALNSGITSAKVTEYDGLNTKTFYLSSTSDLTNAQAALDWYLAGKNPIVVYDNAAYELKGYGANGMQFYGAPTYSDGAGATDIKYNLVMFSLSSGNVTQILVATALLINVLRTGKDYSTPYTPQYDGSPATKKYVDDGLSNKQDALVSGTNIKTINNNSILGSGDLTVSGLPAGGQPGQMIMMTSNGAKWFDVASPTAISLDESSIELNTAGATQQLTATVTPSTAVVTQVDWSSSDTTISTVSSSGLVTCVTPGNATITASTVNGLTATCSVTGGGGWQPGANTIAYYPLEQDADDYSGNNNNLSSTGTVTYTTAGGVDSISTANGYVSGSVTNIPTGASDRTISVWVYMDTSVANQYYNIWYYGFVSRHENQSFQYSTSSRNIISPYLGNYYDDLFDNSVNCSIGVWYNYIYTYDGATQKLYMNGVLVVSQNITLETANSNFGIGGGRNQNLSGNISNVIIEDVVWSTQDVTDYYNLTKGIYGIS